MKIAFLSAASDPWGAENSLFSIAQGLVAQGHQVRIVVQSRVVADFFSELSGVEVVVLSRASSRISTLKNFVKYLNEESSLPGWTKVVFSVDLAPLGTIFGGNAAGPWVYDVHDTPHKLITRMVLRSCLTRYSLAIAISRFALDWGCGARRSVIVPRPIPMPAGIVNVQRSLPVVGIIGRIHPDKNLGFAVDCFKALVGKMDFLFIGSAFGESKQYAEELRTYAASALGSDETFTGRLEVNEAFARIDILFVANPAEPSGRTVGEAMVRGLPVVVPDSGGALEYVEGTDAGLIYSANNVESATLRLAELLDARRRSQLGLEGIKVIASERTPEIVSLRYAAALESVARTR